MSNQAEWTTSVSVVLDNNKVLVRGYSHEEIMKHLSYSDAVFLTLKGELPNSAQSRMFNVLLNSLLDHGFVAASVVAARYIASGNPQFMPAVAGGLLSAGSNTINPAHAFEFIRDCQRRREELGVDIEEAARVITDEVIASRRRIPGLGHPTHRGYDFRATVLRSTAVDCGYFDDAARLYEAVHREFTERTNRQHIPINVDGMMACVTNAMGFTPSEVTAVATLAVLPGLMAQVIEEIDQGPPLRHIPPALSGYTGPQERELRRAVTEQDR